MGEKKKIEWLAVLQGFSMLLVVIGHVMLTNKSNDPTTPIATEIQRVIYTFHMPLFIFISGWLFYFTCIRKEKPYKEMLLSKVKRLVVPFYTFTLVTMVLKMKFPQLMHRMVDWQEIVNTFVLFKSNPLGEMWFVVVLFELMLLYPLYNVMTKNKVTAVAGIVVAILLNKFTPHLSYFNIGKVAYMSPFFVAGILCCKYQWQKYIESYGALLVTTAGFVVCNIMGLLPAQLKIVMVTAGIGFSFSLCLMLARRQPRLFCSFRDYTFQIFLMGIFFQMAIRWIYVRIGNELLFIPMWLLSVVIGVYAPTVIAGLIKRNAPRGIRLCFGL